MSGFEAEIIKPAISQLLRGITNTAFGQAYDVSLPKIGVLSEERVMALHKAKTAIYTFENPLFVGAILGGAGNEVLEILHQYSISGGVAFQLQDDILGIFGDEEKTGKSADSDLLQGKVTLLVSKALELGNGEQIKKIKEIWGNKEATDKEINEAKKIIKDTGSYAYSVEVAKKLAEEAAGWAKKLRKLDLNMEAIDYLEGIARYLVERDV
jgi:geranylgeranyl diphosphate synthase type I